MTRMLLPIFLNLALSVSAQITVTAAIFPTAGDTLRYAVDVMPNGSIQPVTPNGVNQFWDFSSLNADQAQNIIYSDATSGNASAQFAGADMVVLSPFNETYFNKTPTRFEIMGTSGAVQQAFGLNLVARYQPVRVERRAPLTFNAFHQHTTNLSLPFSLDDLPDSLLQGIPPVVDSVRLRLTTAIGEVVDGWGTLRIPGGDYPVLRQKRTEITSTGFDVKMPVIGWIDISSFGFTGLNDLLGSDTSVIYRFFSNSDKEEIAIVTMNNDLSESLNVVFKANPTVNTLTFDAPGNANVQAFPNPAVEWVRFDCTNLPADEYTLKLYNVIGKELWSQTQKMAGNKSIRLELEEFKKGTYLYSLLDSEGTVIGTKRLVILKP